MMAVLPGIDANDESKTAAVFQFYTAGVLRGVRHLVGSSDRSPRLFASQLMHLDAPVQQEHRRVAHRCGRGCR
jgi:hypothetical protein